MKNDIILPVIISFALCAALCPIIIPFLRTLKFGQPVRKEGPQTHLKKSGIPTMGGLCFLLSMTGAVLLYVREYPKIVPILFVSLGFALIGFLDDYIKVIMKNPKGLLPLQKMAGQCLITAIFAYYLLNYSDVGTAAIIPFTGGKTMDLGIFFLPVFFFIMLGTVNGANFTDGLDGLASSVTILIAVFLTMVAIGTNAGITPITGAVVGSLMGFLMFNVYPAKVFMVDTGSLALGGFVASTAYMLNLHLFLPMIAMIYMVEILSVIIQVAYFKKTGGKRIFKMAPIHHHFELCGWSETRVVAVFSIITAVLCMVAYLAL